MTIQLLEKRAQESSMTSVSWLLRSTALENFPKTQLCDDRLSRPVGLPKALNKKLVICTVNYL